MRFILIMKRIVLTLLSLSLPALADQLPPDAEALKAKRDAKIAEINRTYAAELDKLQKKAMADGNLQAATTIQKEIEAVSANSFLNGDESLKSKISGSRWKHSVKGWIITFREDGKISKSWGKLVPPWSIKDGVVLVEDSVFKPQAGGDRMVATGGDKEGTWIKQ